MNHRSDQSSEEFQPPNAERAIENVKAQLVEMSAEHEERGAAFKQHGLEQPDRLNNKILELLQAVSEETDADLGIEACSLVFKEK
ncbi:MAG: hypothetical protein ABSG73_04095 [Candidatus Aminicenantales bacterium]|jgi:ABC-type Zn uptake system ZnuABC Zn-binding protein ZnuA